MVGWVVDIVLEATVKAVRLNVGLVNDVQAVVTAQLVPAERKAASKM
jgi:hypothetical protein